MPNKESCAQCSSSIPGRWLNPNVLEGSFAKNAAVAHAVECHSARQHQIFMPRQLMCVTHHPQHNFFRHFLDRRGNIHMLLSERRFRPTARQTKELLELSTGHYVRTAVGKIVHIQPKRAILFEIQQFRHNFIIVDRLAVRSQPHQLVLARINAETDKIGERRIEQPQRMRKSQLLQHLDAVFFTDADARRRPFPHAVHRQNGRFLKGRGQKSGGRVRLVMAAEKIASFIPAIQRLVHFARKVQLLLQPQRHAHQDMRNHFGVVDECFLRVKRSSWAAATIAPSFSSTAALSW
jgi:hypothetical protein